MKPNKSVFACSGIFLVLILFVVIFVSTNSNQPTLVTQATPTPVVVYVTLTPTMEPTRMPTEAPTALPADDVASSSGTSSSDSITPMPTESPTATPIPTETPMPTESPTATPIPTETPMPTESPTSTPIPTETPMPSESPTATPVVTKQPTDYDAISSEMSLLIMSGGIYPDYDITPTYDLYDYIDVKNANPQRLFGIIRKPFEEGIISWTNMQYDSNQTSATDKLAFALHSSICQDCNRVVIQDNAENAMAIFGIFAEIEREGAYEEANLLLLDYLYNYTVRNPQNSYERLMISCNH